MRISLMGGGSSLGAYLVDRLIESDIDVKCLIKSKVKALSLPYEVDCVLGSPDNHTSLESLFSDTDVAQKVGVKKIVYLSSMMPWNSRHLPLFRNKVRIEEALRGLTIPYTILRPNFSFQSILNFEKEIMERGVYPFPVGHYGVSQIDLRDIAEATFNALTCSTYNWKEYSLCGPEALSGDDIAAILSEAMGRKIVYGGNDIGAWKTLAEKFMPGALIDEWINIFNFLQEEGLFLDRDDLMKQKEILRGESISFRDFSEELALIWKNRELVRRKRRIRQDRFYTRSSRKAKVVHHHHHL